MNRIISSIVSIFLTFISFATFAQNTGMWGELSGNSLNGGVSSSPVSGFSTSRGLGIGIKIGGEIKGINGLEGVSWFGGFDQNNRKLNLTGRNLGNVSSTTFSGGLQLHFEGSEDFQPYIRGGINYTTFDGDSLGNNTLRINDNGSLGAKAEIGGMFLLDKTPFKNNLFNRVGISLGKDWHKQVELRTNAGAKVSGLRFDDTYLNVSVGWSW